jgi:hypothetical protein
MCSQTPFRKEPSLGCGPNLADRITFDRPARVCAIASSRVELRNEGSDFPVAGLAEIQVDGTVITLISN